jgi:hypothetical protein
MLLRAVLSIFICTIMSFDPNKNHSITLADAANMTEAYRNANPTAQIGVAFGKTAVLEILNQTNCDALKCYFANNSNGELTLVLCGAEANQDDLVDGLLADDSYQDPPYSSSANALNS